MILQSLRVDLAMNYLYEDFKKQCNIDNTIVHTHTHTHTHTGLAVDGTASLHVHMHVLFVLNPYSMNDCTTMRCQKGLKEA